MTIRPRSRDTGRDRCAVVSAATSLRDRKRDETRRSLADAAYAIVRDEGVEALTAEAVADRAGVSRRTFFNYFPSVDSVLTASLAQFFDSVTERLHARPADEDVLDTALACLTDSSDTELLERIAVIARAAEVSTHARGLVLVEMHAWLDELEEWLRGRLPEGTSDLVVSTTASIAVGAAEGAFRVWARATADPTAEPVDLGEAVATSLAIARTGLGSARPHRTGSAAGRSS
ncbi:TetR family transcriptional regulator [Oryzobacter sp. R7]|uniref:TetR family transcriptional regulator n=1 Tax=Oryzobacter faecalis TaxID=3388656 RepID=UPI00398D6730